MLSLCYIAVIFCVC